MWFKLSLAKKKTQQNNAKNPQQNNANKQKNITKKPDHLKKKINVNTSADLLHKIH